MYIDLVGVIKQEYVQKSHGIMNRILVGQARNMYRDLVGQTRNMYRDLVD